MLSGSLPFTEAARLVDGDLDVGFAVTDGAPFAAGDTVATVAGTLASILAVERTGLNFLARLSGVATLTARYVAETTGTRARIAATRKTTPGLRALEKQAVVHGGGLPHRSGLFDAAMVKDNHVRAAGGVAAAVELVRAGLPPTQTLEVEVETPRAARGGPRRPAWASCCSTTWTSRPCARPCASRPGVVRSRSPAACASRTCATSPPAGVDIISVGALTTRAPWIDMSLDLE